MKKERFAELLERCGDIAARSVVKGARLTEDDEGFINTIDRELVRLSGGNDVPIVVDLHTHPGEQQVLYAATGWARGIRITSHDASRHATPVDTNASTYVPVKSRSSPAPRAAAALPTWCIA